MNDALRGLVLLVSVVLWLPVLRPVVDGGMTLANGALLYLAALGLSWAGIAGLAALVRGYVRAGEAAARQAAMRRADDVTS